MDRERLFIAANTTEPVSRERQTEIHDRLWEMYHQLHLEKKQWFLGAGLDRGNDFFVTVGLDESATVEQEEWLRAQLRRWGIGGAEYVTQRKVLPQIRHVLMHDDPSQIGYPAKREFLAPLTQPQPNAQEELQKAS